MSDRPDDPAAWTVLGSKYLHRHPWMTLREDRVRLPNGTIIEDYFVLEYPQWVTVLAVTTDDRIVLLRQYRPGLKAVHFELPTGACENGESIEAGARRELLEETGYGGGAWELFMSTSVNPATHNNLDHAFLARGVVEMQEPACEKTEDLRIHLLTMDEVEKIVLAGDMVQAPHAAPLLKYFLLRERGEI